MIFTNVAEALKNKGYSVSCFETAIEATEYLNKCINGTTVGIGGSVTVREMELYEALSPHNDVYWHWVEKNNTKPGDVLALARTADIYIASANALAETGEIINIDGTGNRVSALSYGHKKVYLIIGKNKLAADSEKALFRARNVAAPLNAKRLERNTPCAKGELKCHNCTSPERICKSLSILYEKPMGCDFEIILINESLGY